MLTVSLPTPADIESFGAVPDGVRLVPWDVSGDSDRPDDLDVVLIPPYFTAADGFRSLHGLDQLRLVQLPSAGYEHALPHVPTGVDLANGRGVHDDETAEPGLGLALTSLRGIDDAVRDFTEQRWQQIERRSLADRRVLLIGYGSIGHEIAARLEAFKVELTVVARTAREEDGRHVHAFSELPELLPDAEIVFLIAPLTEETRHLVDAAFLGRLPDGALLVNVARGAIVDTDALLPELHSGRLSAALDVVEEEPLPAGHPLWSAPNVVLTPHVGGYTTATQPRIMALLRRQVESLLAGRDPENVVSR